MGTISWVRLTKLFGVATSLVGLGIFATVLLTETSAWLFLGYCAGALATYLNFYALYCMAKDLISTEATNALGALYPILTFMLLVAGSACCYFFHFDTLIGYVVALTLPLGVGLLFIPQIATGRG